MKFKLFALAAFSIFYAACSFGESMILEKKDTQFFTVKVAGIENGTVNLLISGLSFHSGLSVSEMVSEVENENLLIKVYLHPAAKGGSGRFEYELDVPPTVSHILFGNERVSIWDRGQENKIPTN